MILITSHCTISMSALERAVKLKVRVQMVLQGLIAHKSHATDAAMELDAFEDLRLRNFDWSKQKKG